MYRILGVWQGGMPEELDTAETYWDAIDLARDYRIAFGRAWSITIKRNK
jgi:hypothetical protein